VPVGTSRVAVKMRRNDVTTEPDEHVTDKQKVEVRIRERFLAPTANGGKPIVWRDFLN
jgi:hypothetical protein